MTIRHEKQIQQRNYNRARMIVAALAIWEAGGEKAVTARAVGERCGITGQRVQQVWRSMDALREAAAVAAVRNGQVGVIMQLQAAGHPLAPPVEAARLV